MTYSAPGYAGAPARRRRRRWPIVLLVLLLVIVGLAVLADRAGVRLADRVAGDTIKRSQHLGQRPAVDIAGFPFLTQFAAGTYDNVTVTVHDLPVGQTQRPLMLDTLVVHLHNVTVPSDYRSLSAATGTGEATATYQALSNTLHAPVSYAGSSDGGRVAATGSVTVAGTTIKGSVSTAVRASTAGGLRFVDPKTVVDGIDVPALDTALSSIFSIPIPLDVLKLYGVTVDRLDVTSKGLVLNLSGTNLHFS